MRMQTRRRHLCISVAFGASMLLFSGVAHAEMSACISTAINLPTTHENVPEGAPPIAHFRNLMFLAWEVMTHLDTKCPSDPEYGPARAEFQAIYDNAKKSCTDMAADPASQCRPALYGK